jgi:hypothetical protein
MFYRRNQRTVPSVAGAIVPPFIGSVSQYRREVLAPIYRDLRSVAGAERLRHEWVNSRGAILRFARRALEIRVLDIQECVRMDVAIAIFVRATLRWMVRDLESGKLVLPSHGMLVEDLWAVVEGGRNAHVSAVHLLKRRARAARVVEMLVERARGECSKEELPYLRLLARRAAGGSLAERIRARTGRAQGKRLESKVREIYEELILALETNRPWAE